MCGRSRGGGLDRVATYSYCGEDILELVYQGNEGRVVHVDAAAGVVSRHSGGRVRPRGCWIGTVAYAVGLAAMAGETGRWVKGSDCGCSSSAGGCGCSGGARGRG